MSLVSSAWRNEARSVPVTEIFPCTERSIRTAERWAASYLSSVDICYSGTQPTECAFPSHILLLPPRYCCLAGRPQLRRPPLRRPPLTRLTSSFDAPKPALRRGPCWNRP